MNDEPFSRVYRFLNPLRILNAEKSNDMRISTNPHFLSINLWCRSIGISARWVYSAWARENLGNPGECGWHMSVGGIWWVNLIYTQWSIDFGFNFSLPSWPHASCSSLNSTIVAPVSTNNNLSQEIDRLFFPAHHVLTVYRETQFENIGGHVFV